MSNDARYRVVQFPGPAWDRLNPYRRLFYRALESYGVRCVGTLSLSGAWLRTQAPQIDAIHIHWPEALWRRSGRGRIARLFRVMRLFWVLQIFGRIKTKRIWTVHNLEDHEGADWVDQYGYRVLARAADLLICHSRDAARRVAEQHQPRGRMVVMPHGNYAGVYPPARSRHDVLHELGLRSDRPTICAIGQLRRYKGVDVAIQGIARLAGKVQLIVVGKPHRSLSPDYLAELRNEIDGLDGGLMISREVSEQEYADVVGASEAVLLSYHQVTTSGTMLSALTLGRGVVAPQLPYFQEMLEPEPEAGVLFAPNHSSGLAGAVERYLQIPAERRAAAAGRLAERYAWERCITSVSSVFEAWVREKKERIRGNGIHLIQLLNIPEGFDLAALGFGTVDGIHLLAEALR